MCEVTEGDGYPISIRGLRKEYRSRSGTAVAVAGLDLGRSGWWRVRFFRA